MLSGLLNLCPCAVFASVLVFFFVIRFVFVFVFAFVLVFVFVIGSGLRIVFKQVHFPSQVSFPLNWALWGMIVNENAFVKLWLGNIYYSIAHLEKKSCLFNIDIIDAVLIDVQNPNRSSAKLNLKSSFA